MTTSDTNRTSAYYALESTWGETPNSTPGLKPKLMGLRMTGETLSHSKQTTQSNIIRPDRQRDFIAEVSASAEGDMNFELAAKDLDQLLEAVLTANTLWITSLVTSAIAEAVATGNKFTLDSGEFVGMVVGAEVFVSGFTDPANNGRFVITAVGASEITVSGNALANENAAGEIVFKSNQYKTGDITVASNVIGSAGTDLTTLGLLPKQRIRIKSSATTANNKTVQIETITADTITLVAGETLTNMAADAAAILIGKRISNGVEQKSLLFEKHFEDIDKLIAFTGLRVGSASLQVESSSIVTGTISFMGKQAIPAATTVAGVRQDPQTTKPMNASTNIGSLQEGGSVLSTPIKSLGLSINNNLRSKPAVGNQFPIDIGYGYCDVTGSLSAYFEDLTLLQKMIDHTETSLTIPFVDGDTNEMWIDIPRLYLTSGSPTTPGANDDVMIPLEWQAVKGTTAGQLYSISFDFLSV